MLQSHRNQSVVRQPTAFKSERSRISESRFASQVDVYNNLSKPVTTHYFLKEREVASAKPHHMITYSNSRIISKNMPRFSLNDMVHNHYPEEAKKKTQERNRNSEPDLMPSARSQSTTNGSKPKPRINNQNSRIWPASKSSFGLRWVPTGKIFASSTTMVDSEPLNGSNADITNKYECKQTLDVSAVKMEILLEPTSNKFLVALLSNNKKLLELANTPLNENWSAVILKKLPEKLGDPRKFLILCGFSELKCKALADLANQAICTLAGIARDVFVSVGKFTFLANFVIVDYESDPRVPLILGRPFLRTARALIDVHGEEMILYLFATNHQSGNPTFSSHPNLTSPKVKDDIFDQEGDMVLIEKVINLDSTKDLPTPDNINPLSGSTTSSSPNHLLEEFADELALITFPLGNDDLPFDIEFDLKEIEYLLKHDPIKEMDSILEDSIDENNLADLNDNLFDTILEMFTDEHALDYSSPLLYDDDLFEHKSDNDDAYNYPFNSKGEKIKESKLLIDELDPPRSSDFFPSPTYDLFLFEDFFEVDALPSTNNEDKVFNLGILIHENLVEVNTHFTQDKNVKKITISHASLILEDFDLLFLSMNFLSTKKFPGLKVYSRFHPKMRKMFLNLRFSLLKEFIFLFS
nr:hypothetical protein [Tanacetum cinerariifolium]